MSVHLPILSNSEIRTFRRCPREHQINYRLGYRPIAKADPLRFGSLIHDGLEAWWNELRGGGHALGAAIDAMRANESDPFELAKAEALLLGYDARWLAEPLEVIAVEAEFECALINPQTGATSKTFRLGGKLDAVVRKPDGSTWIVEHKSASEDCEYGSPYWKRLRLDSQVSAYFVGAKALGHDVRGCVYDVIRKPDLRPYRATPLESRKYTKDGRLYANQREFDETPEEYKARLIADIAERPERYFVRGDVVRLEAEESDAAADVWMLARAIRDAEVMGRHPKNVDACVRYGRECEFFAVCTGEASLEDPLRYRRAERRHEELTPKPNAA